MRVLGLCSYPIESATSRYRLTQFVNPLAELGIDLEISSFLDTKQFELLYQDKSLFKKIFRLTKPLFRRVAELSKIRDFDVILVQREAMFFGPAVFEWIFQQIGDLPMVLDLDDATYVHYVSPTYGKIGSYFKFFGKTDNLIKRADAVICGNRFIAEYVRKKQSHTIIIPTVVDTDKFFPVIKNNEIPIIGWIGTHSTFPLLKMIFPVLEKLAEKHSFSLKIVGSGTENVEIKGVKVENLVWNLEREISDFQSLDIGLYPIAASKSASNEWILGKSGFKAVQYMAVGIPFVMSPIGVCAEMGEPNLTHFNAKTDEDWYNSLDRLLSDSGLRKKMGAEARNHCLKHYTLSIQTKILAQALSGVKNNI